ncbi:hypothetical protein KUTeg_011607 [Tegillarca granosa]|uniref:CCHC-type domain-containing protein n=1 Tax=Tegillarca granosa TaxID=220873 RepID=A0ABQ9EX56_TEGGR|nr:hypothetical protein KUTeg_011607 [Tegillarca granosa]
MHYKQDTDQQTGEYGKTASIDSSTNKILDAIAVNLGRSDVNIHSGRSYRASCTLFVFALLYTWPPSTSQRIFFLELCKIISDRFRNTICPGANLITMVQILKHKHSLIGKSLIPVVLKLKSFDGEALEFSRLKKDNPLEAYTQAELGSEFQKLTGESVKDVLLLAGLEDNLDNVKILMHFSIAHANVAGAHKGQTLEPQVTATPNSSVLQLKSIREDIDVLMSRKDGKQVDEALTTVRTLASRPKLTSPNVLMAAIKSLVDIAQNTSHKDAYEENEGFCDLVLKLFGSPEDKKVASVVADWAKARKYESDKKTDKTVGTSAFVQSSPSPGFMPLPYPVNMGMGHYGPRSFSRGARARKPKANTNCFYCNKTGHFVSECPKIKKN